HAEMRGEIAGGIGKVAKADPREVGDQRLEERLVLAQTSADRVDPSELREEDRRMELGHPEVEPEERSLSDLDAAPQGRVPLIVYGEDPSIQVLVVGHDHAAVSGRDRLVLVEGDGPHATDDPDDLPA